MLQQKSYLIEFFKFFIENILPYEVKYSTIKGTKSYGLHKEVIDELLWSFNPKLDDSIFYNRILVKLEEIALQVQTNYYNELIKHFHISQSVSDKVIEKLDSDKYKEAISIIEKTLGIDSTIVSSIDDISLHINDDIYEVDYEKLHKTLIDFREAMEYLEIEYKKQKDKEDKENITATPMDYLMYVVYNESWNFLSHVAHAFIYFDTPNIYISNINKGVAHLRRAILDIYDGLILETQTQINAQYLSIRAFKLKSLGNSYKITNLSDRLRDYYKTLNVVS